MAVLALLGPARLAGAQAYQPTDVPASADAKPGQLQGVDMDYHLGAQVSENLVFTDSTGKRVRLGDYFDGERPVILQLGYYKCPMLCGMVIQGMRETVKEMDFTPGDEYQLISISIDPAEQPSLAKMKKQTFMTDLGKDGAEDGWHFLVGESHMIQKLADEVGFGFKWMRAQQQFAHPAVIMILSPDGTITRYLSGVKYDPKTVRLSLVEASEGKVGSLVDQFLLTCLHYDPSLGTYSATAMGIMRAAGAVTIVLMLMVIGGFLWRDHRRRNARKAHTAAHPAAQG
jgi:protein SCO1